MRPRLLTKKRINAPAAVDPESEACSIEGAAKFNRMLKFHECEYGRLGVYSVYARARFGSNPVKR